MQPTAHTTRTEQSDELRPTRNMRLSYPASTGARPCGRCGKRGTRASSKVSTSLPRGFCSLAARMNHLHPAARDRMVRAPSTFFPTRVLCGASSAECSRCPSRHVCPELRTADDVCPSTVRRALPSASPDPGRIAPTPNWRWQRRFILSASGRRLADVQIG
ncbi:hypothetical protein DENSPDRAFT_686882 [Dentipellis sp. KUC8613]|nr:hypothetical protein DENSPDRAFT_686882 [Dentipellis sp. KUC8613]